MVSVGSVVFGADYNAVRVKTIQVLGSGAPFGPGTGSPNYGYNQSLLSSAVAPADLITHTQYQNLADDINKAYKHQTNTNFSGYQTDPNYASQGALITAADLNTLDTAVNLCVTNRLVAHPAQLTSTATSYTRTTSWGGGASGLSQTGTYTFSSANNMQYYFNQGGKLVYQGFFTSPSGSPIDTAWNTLATAFTYTLNVNTFATLTSTPTVVYASSVQPIPYSSNYINLTLSVSGSTISFAVLYQDDYAGVETVSPSIGFTLTRFSASGAFTGVANPTISLTSNDFV